MKILKSALTSLILLCAVYLPVFNVYAADELSEPIPCSVDSEILVTEVQAGTSNFRHEFVELHNNSTKDINFSGCKLLLQNENKNLIASVELSHTIPAGGFLLVIHNSYVNFLTEPAFPAPHVRFATLSGDGNTNAIGANGGYITVVGADGVVIDNVSFGNVDNGSGVAPQPPANLSIKRCINEDGFFARTSNDKDFSITSLLTLSMLFKWGSLCPALLESELGNECQGIILTEIGANLSSEEQFIEIYNSTTQEIDLTGCQLMTNRSSTTSYTFGDEELQPSAYLSVLIKDTALTLTKTTSGTVYFLSSEQVENSTQSYKDLKVDTSFASFGSGWKQTFKPTPGAGNVFQEFLPCPVGQERNPDTSRCIDIANSSSSLKPCRSDQFRNPETNRCKLINLAGSALVPCSPGQFRNPETNRCKSLTASTSSLIPCEPDQERNPETNRCRKITGAGAAGDNVVQDVLSVTEAQNQTGWAVAGASFVGATGYAVWEWRNELWEKLLALKNKLGFK